ncbi:MAG: PEP-CTERM sorting domain-containing protein [Thiobacillaceae bacterium]
MNTKMKALAAATLAAVAMASPAAHAMTEPGPGLTQSGSLFLYVYDSRDLNPAATNTAIFDLGALGNTFNTSTSQSWDVTSLGTAWSSYIAPILAADGSDVQWGVFAATGPGGTGSSIVSTMSTVAGVSGTALSSTVANADVVMSTYNNCSPSCGYSAVTTNDLASTKWDKTAGVSGVSYNLVAGLGSSMDFYQYTSTGTKGSNAATELAFATNGTADYFTLNSAGTLTYTAGTAAVPEADTYAMMLAGLGLVGAAIRRRKAA